LPDKDRPLNDRGKRDAPKMGERLAKRDVKPHLILSSPATRALKTAKIIAKKLDYKLKDILADKRGMPSGRMTCSTSFTSLTTSWSA
jgi:phosphohistidine phosphatase